MLYDANDYDLNNRMKKMCNESVDNKTIFTDFQNQGYRTLYSEDWEMGTLTLPHCTGFQKIPMDHSARLV